MSHGTYLILGIGNVEAHSAVPQVLQEHAAYQVLGKDHTVPVLQYPVKSNVQVSNPGLNATSKILINNAATLPGLKISGVMSNVKNFDQSSYFVQSLNNTNNYVYKMGHPVRFATSSVKLPHAQGNNQPIQMQNLGFSGEGINSVNMAASTSQTVFEIPKVANVQSKGIVKVPEPKQVNTKECLREKIGQLKIQISETFLSWNTSNRTILDLEFMRHLFDIQNIDIIFPINVPFENGIYSSVKQILYNRILSDWLVLKCEEKQIPFFKVNNQVEIYCVNNFTTLLDYVSRESCLPLPYITEDQKNQIKYFYLNFPKSACDKVRKLNVPVFHIPHNGRKKVSCKYPGIRLDCTFEPPLQNFTIHVHQSAVPTYEASVSYIRQHLIYNHIVWGFLQSWIQRVKEQYNSCFKLHDIAKNLSLCQAESPESITRSGVDSRLIYFIDYMNFYLKFDPVTLKETNISFSIDNFATNSVCNVPIVQYYKQFFLINDLHYSDALKNVILFFRNCNNKNAGNINNAASLIQLQNSGPSSIATAATATATTAAAAPPTAPTVSNTTTLMPEKRCGIDPNKCNNAWNPNLSKSSSVAPAEYSFRADFSTEANTNANQQQPEQISVNPTRAKPLLKTRTVEEINSSVDANKIFMLLPATNASTTMNPEVKTQQIHISSFYSLVQKVLKNCYATNNSEISTEDDSVDMLVVDQRFNEAVNRAINMLTLESFIEAIYQHLQLYYTNCTCRCIMNRLIWKALRCKYPTLKTYDTESPSKSGNHRPAQFCDSSQVTADMRNKHNITETEGHSNLLQIGSDRRNPQSAKTNWIPLSKTQNCQLEIKSRDSNTPVYCIGENNTVKGAKSKVCQVVTETVSASQTSTSPKFKTKSKSPKTSKITRKNAVSPTLIKPKNCPKKGTETLSKKVDDTAEPAKDFTPYRNTLTLVRVSTSPATFKISTKSKNNPETDDSTMKDKESAEGPVKVCSPQRAPEEEEKFVQTAEETAVEDKAGEECPKVNDYSHFNLKPCSVVLNSEDVKRYMENLVKRKAEETPEESDIDSDSDMPVGRLKRIWYSDSEESDCVGRKRMLRKKRVSELQYMEARTRVLQRLRKRKAIYGGCTENRRISGDELDSFFVRRNSFQRLVCHEDEHESEPEESEPEEPQLRETGEGKSYGLKELRVVLVRVEDTPEGRRYLDRKEKSNPMDGYLKCESFPQLSPEYFQVRDGKLYLKGEYRVENGKIVPVDGQVGLVKPKNEPRSPVIETEIGTRHIKTEEAFD